VTTMQKIKNFLVTGPPGSGKTSVVERVIKILSDRNLKAGGLYCPEIREKGERLGFKIVDIATGETKILAHVNQPDGPKVSKYRVNVRNVDEMSGKAIERALKGSDFIVIDEIAPMEVHSSGFREFVIKALDSDKPLLAVIHQRTSTGFIGKVKSRADVMIFEVNPSNRDRLPDKLAEMILGAMK
jgi:nucleoside-triphosphatase